jgi:hypothetical protein
VSQAEGDMATTPHFHSKAVHRNGVYEALHNADPPRRNHARQGAAIALGQLRGGQGELKYRTAGFIRLCPRPAPMGVYDRPANRQPHPCSAGLCGAEGIEKALEMFRRDARPGIVQCDKDTCVVLPRADQQLSRRCLNRAHCFERVQEQIQDHLLQLNATTVHGAGVRPGRATAR